MIQDVLRGSETAGEVAVNQTLRPQSFDEYFGQEKVVQNLKILIQAAKIRGEQIDHILFSGPPGLGKTTLAHIIAKEMGSHIVATSGPALERAGDLVAIITALNKTDILFIDEVHRMNRTVEETLYQGMEDYSVDIVIGKGPGARTVKLKLEKFSLIGATTRTGLLTGPFRDRFGLIEHLDFYTVSELEKVARRTSKILGLRVTDDGITTVAKRARGTPRVVNRLSKRISDFALVKGIAEVDSTSCDEALLAFGIDEYGLDRVDRLIIEAIVNKFNGGPVGIDTIAAVLNEENDTIEEVYEPYLLKIGFIKRTPRGRVAANLAYEYLGLQAPPSRDQEPLFHTQPEEQEGPGL